MDMSGDVLRELFLELANTFSRFDKTVFKYPDSSSGTFAFDRKEIVAADCEGSESDSGSVGRRERKRERENGHMHTYRYAHALRDSYLLAVW